MASIAQVQIADPPRSRSSHPDLGVLCPTTMMTTTTAAATTTTTRTDPNQGLAGFEKQMQNAVQTLSDLIHEQKTLPAAKDCRSALAQAEGHLAGVAEHARNNRPTWTSCLFSRQSKRSEQERKLRRFVTSVRTSFESLGERCGKAEEKAAGVRGKALALTEEVARGPWAAVCELKARRLETSGGCDGELSKAAVLRAHIAVKLSLTKLGELVGELQDEETGLRVVREKCAFVARRLGFVLEEELEEEDFGGLIWGLKYAVEDVQAWDPRLQKKSEEKSARTEKKRSGRSNSVVDALVKESCLMLRG